MISVVMSVYKEPEMYLRKSIESILNQSVSEFEYIIILDEPSNQQALQIIREYEQKDRRVKLFINEKNIGLTRSLNKALQFVSGEYVARMDADDLSEPNRFELQLKYLQENGLDIVGSSMRRISELGDVVNEQTNRSYPPECIEALLRYDNCVPHPSWLLKKSVYDSLKGYNDINACEDYEFLLRAHKNGFKIGLCDEILLNYRINTNGISRNNSLRQLLTAVFLQKNIDYVGKIEQYKIDTYLNKKITASATKKYEIAVMKMNDILEQVKKGKKIALLRLFPLTFESKYICINFVRIVKMWKVKRKYL